MSLRTCRQQGQMTPYAIRLERKKMIRYLLTQARHGLATFSENVCNMTSQTSAEKNAKC